MAYSKVHIPGDRLVVCDICGFEYRFSQMRKGIMGNQKGYNVGPECFDSIHQRETKPKYRKEGVLPEIR